MWPDDFREGRIYLVMADADYDGKLVIYASKGLNVALFPAGASYVGREVTICGIPMRRLDAEYLAWLRKNFTCSMGQAKQFKQIVAERMPELSETNVAIPPGYREPRPFEIYTTDSW